MSLQESIKKIRTLPELNSNNCTLHSMTDVSPASFLSFFFQSKKKIANAAVCSVYTVQYRVLHYKAEFYGVELL